VVKVLSSTNGRDKVSKLIQYASRTLGFYLSKSESTKDLSNRFNNLFKGTASARKLTRLFKSLEFLNNMTTFITKNQLFSHFFEGKFDLETIYNGIRNKDVEVLNLLSQFFFALYFYFDHFVWFINIGFLKRNDVNDFKKKSMKYWFYGLLLAVISDVLVYVRLTKSNEMILNIGRNDPKKKEEMRENIKKKYNIILNFVRNLGDICVSSHGAEMVNVLDDGLLGICGSIASVIGFYQAWPEKK